MNDLRNFGVRQIFVAYPYALGEVYREALATSLPSSHFALQYADHRITSGHLLQKIERYLAESDLALFDLTDVNPNVILELGIAIGAGHPYVVAIANESVGKLNADIHGWDQVRYDSVEELSRKLRDYIDRDEAPRREPAIVDAAVTVANLDHGFFLGEPDAPELAIIAVPLPYRPGRPELAVLRDGTFDHKILMQSVLDAMNVDRSSKSNFWPDGFNYQIGEDFYDIFRGNADAYGETLRLRLSDDGVVRYVNPMVRHEDRPPLFDLSTLEDLITNAIRCSSKIYQRLELSSPEVAFSVAIRNAPDLQVNTGGSRSRRLRVPVNPLVLPKSPDVRVRAAIEADAAGIAKNICRILETKLVS